MVRGKVYIAQQRFDGYGFKEAFAQIGKANFVKPQTLYEIERIK
jgi:hypothetical protein